MIYVEELHAADVDKMLRKPGEIESFSARLANERPARLRA